MHWRTAARWAAARMRGGAAGAAAAALAVVAPAVAVQGSRAGSTHEHTADAGLVPRMMKSCTVVFLPTCRRRSQVPLPPAMHYRTRLRLPYDHQAPALYGPPQEPVQELPSPERRASNGQARRGGLACCGATTMWWLMRRAAQARSASAQGDVYPGVRAGAARIVIHLNGQGRQEPSFLAGLACEGHTVDQPQR